MEQEVKEIVNKTEESFSVKILLLNAGRCEGIRQIGNAFARAQLTFLRKSLTNETQGTNFCFR